MSETTQSTVEDLEKELQTVGTDGGVEVKDEHAPIGVESATDEHAPIGAMSATDEHAPIGAESATDEHAPISAESVKAESPGQ